MVLEVEKSFVDSFVIKRKRERVIYELQHVKLREDCVWHLSYFLISDLFHIIPSVAVSNDILQALKNVGVIGQMYLLMEDQEKCGFYSLPDVVNVLWLQGSAGFAYSPEANVAFFVTEEYKKVILHH